ncbi:MAG: 5-oxoprolinase, partial [Synechococcaceae bacterium WB8_1B_136]|nr:5-oxoprolinase [Synechococcaceae bacterium WB8_1B_136]
GLRLQVGPESAGADPGPACYGRGGPLTITDANLLLGRLQPDHLPALFGSGGDQRLDPLPARLGFEQLASALGAAGSGPSGEMPSPEQVAEGGLAIAVERMAEAIRRISIQQGRDLRRAVLCSFGGAGGQHACAVAEALGMERVLLHPLAGVLSAYGIGLADEVELIERSVRQPLTPQLLQTLAAELTAEAHQLTPETGERHRCTLQLRSAGADTCLPIPWADPAAAADGAAASICEGLLEAFAAAHRRRFGFAPAHGSGAAAPVLERLSLERIRPGLAEGAQLGDSSAAGAPPGSAHPPLPRAGAVSVYLHGAWQAIPLWQRSQLQAGAVLVGPALIVEPTGTNLLLPGWGARLLAGGSLLLERQALAPSPDARAVDTAVIDPLSLELFSHRFTAIAEQMGTRLQQTSSSVNIKERLDFSCALFDASGALVVNAPHIPVHLGSMGESVVALLAAVQRGERQPLAAGDAVVSNNPYNGGTHLPDLTLITPVFAAPGGAQLVAFVASRGHHADVGGITPGSMPPHSTCIEEEGLLLDNVPLLEQGAFDETSWRQRLAAGRHPVRNPDQLLADLQAQLAA